MDGSTLIVSVVATITTMSKMNNKKSSSGNGKGHVYGYIETLHGPLKLVLKGGHLVKNGTDSKIIWLEAGATVETFHSAGIPSTAYEVVEVEDDSLVEEESDDELPSAMLNAAAKLVKKAVDKKAASVSLTHEKKETKLKTAKATSTVKKANQKATLEGDSLSDSSVDLAESTKTKQEEESESAAPIVHKHGTRGKSKRANKSGKN